MTQPRRWTVDHVAREDAERLFVPAADLPDAHLGDVVEFTSEANTRSGRILEQVDDDTRGSFYAVELDRPEQ